MELLFPKKLYTIDIKAPLLGPHLSQSRTELSITAMKTNASIKLYRDQSLFKDVGFLLLATVFILTKGFDLDVVQAVAYTPLIVFGGFGLLVALGYMVTGLLRLLERVEIRLGMRRGAKY
jgi:hypothetical protein